MWQRVLLGVAIGIPVTAVVAVAAVLGLLFGASVLLDASGCGSIDPTDAANYSSVAVLNDTNSPVILDDCPGAYCHADELPVRIAPGQRFHDDAACGAAGSDMTSWRVRRTDGTVLGYVAVATPRKHDGLVFRVSRASQDRRTPTPSG